MPCPHARLTRLILEQVRGARLITADREDWTSVTFTGTRHALTFAAPCLTSPQLEHGLAADLFAIPGHLVADLSTQLLHRDGDELMFRVDALTLEDH